MKKTFLFVIIAALVAGTLLAGCTGGAAPGSPTQVTTDFLNAVKANDTATMAKYYDGELDENALDLSNMFGEESDMSPAIMS